MTNVSKLFVVIGCILILAGVVSKVASLPIVICTMQILPISFVIMANTSFLLAILLKK